MIHSELDKVITRVGGIAHLTDMLTQITRALHCPLVRSLAERSKGLDSLYDFFVSGPIEPLAGYYLEIDEDPDPALAAYDTLSLVYGHFAEVHAGEGYTFPFIKCADNRYALIKLKEYPWLVH